VTRRLVATYRWQLDPDADLHRVADLVDHLDTLGVSHVYLSPLFEARPDSTHGYDVVDPTRVRTALGGRRALDALARALHARDLGIVLDVVPNHLAAGEHNAWWWSVLRDGPASPDASVFDVDWPAGDGRVLLPVLGAPLAEVLAAGELTVAADDPEPVLRYFDRRFPLRPDVDRDLPLPELLAAQHYTLTHWRAPARNVRRFFDIDDLVGVRVEDPDVFARTHTLVEELAAAGVVDALRVDHVDGLRDPAAYLERLDRITGVPVLVEKVLGPDEELPSAWPVAGTTGYEELTALDTLFVDAEGLRTLDRDYRAEGGRPFAAVERAARGQVLADLFPSEWAARSREAAALLGVDVTEAAVPTAVRSLTLGLDVYRTYLAPDRPASKDDRARLLDARAAAGSTDTDADATLGRLVDALTSDDAGARVWAARWQQLSGAVMAKGHEDTAYYRHTRLLALDEVGGDPDGPLRDGGRDRFHAHQQRRLDRGRPGLTTTTTHDTKRSEDARSRLLALTEVPDEWRIAFGAFRAAAPDALDLDEARLLAQTLLASWPADPDGWPDYPARVATYLRKALREAKRATSWTEPDLAHEEIVLEFAASLLADDGAAFDRHFGDLRRRVARAGAVTALTRVVVKHAVPGVPDLYRGAERWALDLADPDNRRPVDHAGDVTTLAGWWRTAPHLATLRRDWPDGRIKLWCTWRSLVARRARPDLFLDGDYTPLRVSGPRADAVVAFARSHGDERAVVVGARRGAGIASTDELPVGAAWAGTTVELPAAGPPLRDALRPGGAGPSGRLDELLRELPVALLVTDAD
jgi:malto-oligosyltrehalose synthase